MVMAVLTRTRAASINGMAMSKNAAEGNRRQVGPPKLRFHFMQRIKMLLLINMIPIVVGVGLSIGYYQGMVHVVGFEEGKHGLAIAVILAACIILGLSWWIIIPFARWAYMYPRWFFRHESKFIWFMPFCCGSIFYALCWILCMLAGIIACVAVLSMLYIFVFGVPNQAPPPDTAWMLLISDMHTLCCSLAP